MKLRLLVLWLTVGLVLGVVNWQAFQREQLLGTGEVVFLELAPVDPRSLIQGDYMQLRYAIAARVENPGDGFIVVQLDENRVAHYVRVHDPRIPLAANQQLLRYRWRASGVSIGPESFFFQEGQAEYYQNAHYAELRVFATGEVALIGLRGDELEPLGAP